MVNRETKAYVDSSDSLMRPKYLSDTCPNSPSGVYIRGLDTVYGMVSAVVIGVACILVSCLHELHSTECLK